MATFQMSGFLAVENEDKLSLDKVTVLLLINLLAMRSTELQLVMGLNIVKTCS